MPVLVRLSLRSHHRTVLLPYRKPRLGRAHRIFGLEGHHLSAPHLRTVPCFFIVLWIASVQQRASPALHVFEFGLHARRPLHLRVERPRSLLRLVCITGVFYIGIYSYLPIWILRQFFLCLIHAYGSSSSGPSPHMPSVLFASFWGFSPTCGFPRFPT